MLSEKIGILEEQRASAAEQERARASALDNTIAALGKKLGITEEQLAKATLERSHTTKKLDSTEEQLAALQKMVEKLSDDTRKLDNRSRFLARTFIDCSERIGALADSSFLFPIRNRLNRIALKLKTRGEEAQIIETKPQSKAPASAESKPPAQKTRNEVPTPAAPMLPTPRSSNPFLDKQSTTYTELKAQWKQRRIPASQQVIEWQEARRNFFKESGESARIDAMAGKHRGKRCFIVGNGPSLKHQDLSFLKNEITFVTNWFVNSDQYSVIDPDYYCVSSHEMFGGWNKPEPQLNSDFHKAMVAKASDARKFFSFAFRDHIVGDNMFPPSDVNYLLFERPKRLVDEAGEINLDLTRHLDDGYTVVQTLCIPLALHFGITEIYLLGCDCDYGINKPEDPKQYCYDSSLHTTTTTKFENLQLIWKDDGPVFKSYEIVRDAVEKSGARLFNATHGGRLEVVPRVEFRSLFP